LNAARLFAAALTGSVDGVNDEQRRLAGNVERSIVAADGLLKSLLDISKLDAGGVTPKPTRFRAAQLIDELVSEFEPIAASRGLKLRKVPGPGWVETDRVLLRSVLQNLISNAIRYTENGSILIGCRFRGEALRIEVWDTGIGIPEERLGEIFQEFRRLEGDHGIEKGVGLGLAIVERIAQLLAIEVSVKSKVRRGSVFTVILPAVRPGVEGAAVPIGPTQADSSALQGLRVLCVDNEPAILDGLSSLLGRWGCLPMLAAGAADAWEWLEESAIDVALVDHNLDGPETGIDVLNMIGRHQRGAFLGVLITADARPALAEEARRLGYEFMAKPIDPALLRSLLARPSRSIAAD
jgi:CheY-like chemotaxis protein/anti-sigma regulatory factor (Ser/Thr protein kinase)